ncbi:MAG TPA: glycoside hydrolase family 15 protein [Steroidobacteraceae bacterium]|jgi:glucoamylase
MEPLEQWVERQYRYSAEAMLRSVSPLGLVKSRPGFGQTIHPLAGSIVASPVLAAYDPDPDYFFHWFRDSAVVIDALRLLFEAGALGGEAIQHVKDFVAFSSSLTELDGRKLVSASQWRGAVTPGFKQYLRDDAELSIAHGEHVVAETRVNPDGTLDISKWCRPQHDGPALRALVLLRWLRAGANLPGAAELIHADLTFVSSHWREPSYDIWEEERGQHYYTLRVAAAALEAGAAWLADKADPRKAHVLQTESQEIRRVLDGFWAPEENYYRSRVLASGQRSTKELDIAVILAVIHSDEEGGARPHTVHDPRIQATLDRLEVLFAQAYPINRNRRGVAMGRYDGDVYYSGGAYYFSTLGAAELCYRAAVAPRDGTGWLQRGDAFLRTVQEFTPPGGELSEQFDKATGVQTSARHLAWSYAALISCVAARRRAMQH